LVIEVDGYSHNFEDTLDNDLEKEQFFNSLTITILRFDDKEVMEDLNNVLKVIEGYILSFEKLHTP
jgi:very-short-patch-repair endonuclease